LTYKKTHTEVKAIHKCDYCEELFFALTYKKTHTEKCHSEFVMSQCELCPKSFKHKAALYQHMDKVHDSTIHICDKCSKEFNCKVNLKRHLRKHDDSFQLKVKFPCDICKKSGRYQTSEKLQKHILEEHSGKEHICSECSASFSNSLLLHGHKRRLHDEKTLKCDQCSMMFATQNLKNNHTKVKHVKAKDKVCPYCGEAFEHPTTFEAHVKRHTDDRQYSCETCGKAFLIEVHLKNHIKRHILPIRCELCTKGFTRNSYLQDHIRKVHEGLEVTCRWGCGWKSMTKELVTKHETRRCGLNPVPGTPYVRPGHRSREQGTGLPVTGNKEQGY